MTLWYLHVDGLHCDQFDDMEAVIAVGNEFIRKGHSVHIETRDQWLETSDKYAEDQEKIYRLGVKYGMNKKEE